MPIKQISKISVRSGLQQDLPLLSTGELGWAIDSQKLFIGNGTVAEGAPFAGNTEILTGSNGASSSASLPVQGAFNESPNGTRVTFTMNITPFQNSLIVWKNYPLIPGIGYNYPGLSGPQSVTFTSAPDTFDNLYYYCWI